MDNPNDSFYLNQSEPNKGCLIALRLIILSHDDSLSETRKYSMPCFIQNKKALCYLWVDKKTTEPYLLMVDGQKLHHPMLEQGSRSRMKIFRVNPNSDIPLSAIKEILNEALALKK